MMITVFLIPFFIIFISTSLGFFSLGFEMFNNIITDSCVTMAQITAFAISFICFGISNDEIHKKSLAVFIFLSMCILSHIIIKSPKDISSTVILTIIQIIGLLAILWEIKKKKMENGNNR